MSRRGFTVLELLLALVVTALAVTLAASAVRAATSVRDRVATHRERTEGIARLQALLTDMLRHAPAAERVDEPLLRVIPGADGLPSLIFVSQGVRPPYGTGAPWRVTLHTSAEGIVLEAIPLGRSPDGTILRSIVPGIRTMSVQLLEAVSGRDGARWRADWPLAASRPAAVAITLGAGATTEASLATAVRIAPLVVSLDPLQDQAAGRP